MTGFLRWTAVCACLAVITAASALAGWPTPIAVAATWGLAYLTLTGPRKDPT